MEDQENQLKSLIGKKVQILQPGHPWYGRIGTVVAYEPPNLVHLKIGIYMDDTYNPTTTTNQFQVMF